MTLRHVPFGSFNFETLLYCEDLRSLSHGHQSSLPALDVIERGVQGDTVILHCHQLSLTVIP
jgi:hypothetical protein